MRCYLTPCMSLDLILTFHCLPSETKSLTWTATTSSWAVRRDKRVETVLAISSAPVSWPVRTSYRRNVINFWVKNKRWNEKNRSRYLNSISINYFSSKSCNIVYHLINFRHTFGRICTSDSAGLSLEVSFN